jgi:hypothetical protein
VLCVFGEGGGVGEGVGMGSGGRSLCSGGGAGGSGIGGICSSPFRFGCARRMVEARMIPRLLRKAWLFLCLSRVVADGVNVLDCGGVVRLAG